MNEKTKLTGKTIINVCGKADTGKTTGIKAVIEYYEKSYSTPDLGRLLTPIYELKKNRCQTERFEILLINGKRVGFYTRGDVDDRDIRPAIVLLFVFDCDVIVVASRLGKPMQDRLKILSGDLDMTCVEIFTECKKEKCDPTLAKEIKKTLEKALRA